MRLFSDSGKTAKYVIKNMKNLSPFSKIWRHFSLYYRNKLEYQREKYLSANRKKLVNTDFSIIASNCIGGNISHDLGVRFNSPFINLWICPKDYIKLLSSLKTYLNYPLKFVVEKDISYPVAYLNDIKLYFQHYENCEIAEQKWNERVSRINYDNLFITFTDRDGCTEKDLEEFDRLPYPNKVVFTHKPYTNISSAYYIKGFENDSSVGILSNYESEESIVKYYNQFDFVKWLNKDCKR